MVTTGSNYIDMEVFENSGRNLAEYLMSKKPNQPQQRLFNFEDTPDSQDVSVRVIQRKSKSSRAPARATPTPPPLSFNSGTTISSRFEPAVCSTPYANVKGIICRNSKIDKNNTTHGSRSSSAKRVSFHPNEVDEGPWRPDVSECHNASASMRNPNQPRSPEYPPVENDDLERTLAHIFGADGSAQLKVRSVAELNSAAGNELQNLTFTKDLRKSKEPSPNVEDVISLISDDEDSPEYEEHPGPSSDPEEDHGVAPEDNRTIVNTSHPRTIRESQRMEISITETPIRVNSRKSTHGTKNNLMSILEDWSDNDTIVYDGGRNEAPMPEKEVTQENARQNNLSSGFIDASSQTSRIVSQRRQNTAIPARIQEEIHENISSATLHRTQTQQTLPNRTELSSTFKAPPAKGRKKRPKKIDSPLQRQIDIEKSVRTSVSRSLGTSRRKLYSQSTQNDDEDSNESCATSSSRSSGDQPVNAVQDEEVIDEVPPIPGPSQLLTCNIVIDRTEVEKLLASDKSTEKESTKDGRKKKVVGNKRKRPVAEIEEIEEDAVQEKPTLRRSTRTRYAPMAPWMKIHNVKPLVVKTYNENVSLRKRYVRMGTDDTPDLRGDFTMIWEKKQTQKEKTQKKAREREKAQKRAQGKQRRDNEEREDEAMEGVEPQVDAGEQEVEPTTGRMLNEERNEEACEEVPVANTEDCAGPSGSNPKRTLDDIVLYCVHDYERQRIDYYETESNLPGIRTYRGTGHDKVGYMVFEPGTKKPSCTLMEGRCMFQVFEGQFKFRVDKIRSVVNKGDVLFLNEGQKYYAKCINRSGLGEVFYMLLP
ncbi:uncharacterized protein LOC129790969 isoform X2 [Lutzomyia longipalpis]|uniref:uncharacterized protein LOC129790969 isoform X2 n=1 Tax=Lutzomyia longipalpis TaxID=7200 RepID=UPI002483CDFC|nr:uncharacterized protein LOC129790969 isoform X2 [Lutzomyia longipalpis]